MVTFNLTKKAPPLETGGLKSKTNPISFRLSPRMDPSGLKRHLLRKYHVVKKKLLPCNPQSKAAA
jgi:hypothetical protein